MNQVKSTHHTIDHFGSVKYAELVDPMEENENSKQSCTCCCCFIHFFFFLLHNLQKLLQEKSEYDTFVGQIMFVTMKVCCSGRQ
jgi:hypothetical protein